MSKCNGKCGSCSDKKKETNSNPSSFPFRKEVDVSYFLEPLSKQEEDSTSLDYPCKCDWQNGKTKRYMCLPCIKTYIEAVSYEEAMEEANRLEKNGKRVAAERVREIAEHKKWKDPINE